MDPRRYNIESLRILGSEVEIEAFFDVGSNLQQLRKMLAEESA